MIEQVKSLEEVLEPYAGKIVYCESEQKTYRFDPVEGWQEVKMEGGISMSAYDINKQIMGQIKALTEEELAEKKELVREYLNRINDKFYMLLCRDINYYTIFHKLPMADERLENALIDDCLSALGQIKSIELTEDEVAIEIWLEICNEVYVAYFFPYGNGVIECE